MKTMKRTAGPFGEFLLPVTRAHAKNASCTYAHADTKQVAMEV